MSTFNSKNLSEEQVRRLILARVKAIQRKKAAQVFLRAATDTTHGIQPGRIDDGVVRMFQDALLRLDDAAAKLPKGFPREPGNWKVLEELLGKDIVDGWRG